MSPFTDSTKNSGTPLLSRFAAPTALIAFVCCFILGAFAVAWRAKVGVNSAKEIASTAALARSAALESQIGQAVAAAEVLGALAKRSGGAIPNFQQVATELLAAHPGLASLELQPGGVVSDIVPRSGHERVVGLNVLNHLEYGPGASAARQRRTLTVTGPVTLYRGEPGFIIRVPLFQRGRDGRDLLWGFVAVSIRSVDLLAQTQLQDLPKLGYNYVFYTPASAQQKGGVIARYGAVSLPDSVRQTVRAPGLEMGFVIQRRGGWIHWTEVAIESLVVLVFSGLIALLVNLLESRQAVEGELANVRQRLLREGTERNQMQEELHKTKMSGAAAEAELKQAQSVLHQAQSDLAETQARLEAVQLSNAESSKAFEARLAEVESKAGILQDQFNAAVRTAEEAKQAKQAEMETARLRLQEMKQTVAQLQTRLETAVRAEKETAASAQARLQQDQETINDLKARLDVATRHAKGSEEAATSKISQLEENIRELMARLAAAQDRLQQDQTTNADLQTRLDVATRRLKESEEAATSKIGQLEESHRELMARLAIAEQAEFRVTELTAQLEAARSELRAQLEVSAQSAETPNTVLNSNEPAQVSEKDSGESVMPIIEFYEEPAVESVASPGSTEETVAPTVAEEEAVPVLAKTEIVPSETLAVAETLPVAAPVLEPESPKVPISVETASESAPIPVESPAKTKAPKVTKRKKARRDAQMDLFGGSGERQEPPHPDTANIAEELAAGENDLPKHEPAPPAELPVANESEAPADDTNGKQTLDQPEPQPEQEIENPVPEPKLPAESGLNLPPIEGLAINDGLALADGNAALYLKALLGFVEQQASAPAKIRDALVQGDAAAAARVLQGLKSVAGEIGANTVHHTAVALAQSIQGDGEPGEIEFLWAELEKAVQTLVTDLKSALVPKEEKAAPVRRLPAPPPVNPPQLRKAISQILPLLVDSDPGAKDCLKDNRSTFRSAFTPEGYAEFEQCVKSGDFHQALEHLKKAAKKHNISV